MKKFLSMTFTILAVCSIGTNALAACLPTTTPDTGQNYRQFTIQSSLTACGQQTTCPNYTDCKYTDCKYTDWNDFIKNFLQNTNCESNCTDPGNPNQNNDQCNNSNDDTGDIEDNSGNNPNNPDNNYITPDNIENPNQTPNQTQNPTQNSGQNQTYIQQVLSLVNQQRAANGLTALVLDDTVSAAAQIRAEECAQNFSHTRPNGTPCFTALKTLGVTYSSAAENIAYGQTTPQEVVTAWMNSDGHRKNILNSKYTKIGIGYATINGTPYWSQFFIS